MNQFSAVSSHFFCHQITDQWIVDRLFSYDMRQVEVKQAVNVFMAGRDNETLQKYVKKFKNPNRKGSGGTYCQNPMRNNKELAQIYTVLCHQVINLEKYYREIHEDGTPVKQAHRLLLIATLDTWETFKNLIFIQKKKIRLIDLIAVVTYYLQMDWEATLCTHCGSVASKIDGIMTPCLVCAANQQRKSAIRQQQAKEAVRI